MAKNPDMEEETRKTGGVSPATAGALALLLWGGGFLYLRKPLAATLALVALLVSGTLFGALSGVFPSWMAGPLLRDLHWAFPLGPSLLVSGFAFSLLWWASIVVPTAIAREKAFLNTPRPRNPLILVTASFLPMIGHFSQGKFRRGYLSGLFYFWAPMAAAAGRKIWNDSLLEPSLDGTRLEPYFIAAVVLCAGSFLATGMALWSSVTGALLETGWLQPHRKGGRTEWKFVALGSALVIVVALYLVAGPVGRRSRSRLLALSSDVEARGFNSCAEMIRGGVRGWEKAGAPFQDFVQRLR
jgi:hypothetical protein